MRNSEHRVLTSHVGSLPRPDELIARVVPRGVAGRELAQAD